MTWHGTKIVWWLMLGAIPIAVAIHSKVAGRIDNDKFICEGKAVLEVDGGMSLRAAWCRRL